MKLCFQNSAASCSWKLGCWSALSDSGSLTFFLTLRTLQTGTPRSNALLLYLLQPLNLPFCILDGTLDFLNNTFDQAGPAGQ